MPTEIHRNQSNDVGSVAAHAYLLKYYAQYFGSASLSYIGSKRHNEVATHLMMARMSEPKATVPAW
jgi:hypothetical protein